MTYSDIFFDLDHTLWDFDANAKETLTDIYKSLSLEETIAVPFDSFYKQYLMHNAILWDRYHKGFISSEELKWKRMWRTLLDFKIADGALAKKMSTAFLEILPTKTLVFDYTFEILQYLKNKRYNLHVITNGFEKTQWSKLNNSGLAHFFKHVITSEGSNYVKPSQEIFEFAVNKANTTLMESIMIGDNLDADIQGALNAGMDNIFVNHINAKPYISPTYTVTHLKQIENIL